MSWQDAVKERQELVLASSSQKGDPRAIMVISLGLVDNKLLIGACLMKTTLENIKNNPHVSLVAKNNGDYFRIEGQAEIQTEGKNLESAIKKSNPPLPTSAILVEIREVFDLAKQKKVF